MSRRHPVRALAAALAAFLLTASPLAARAADPPAGASTPQNPVAPAPVPAPAAKPAGNAPASVGSVIHPGDTLAISVYGDQPVTAVVQADGTIQYPLAGRVFVGGMSAAEARDSLTLALKKFYKHPVVSLAVQQSGEISVTVLGNVKNPGKYQMRSGSRLSDALAAGGGVGTIGGQAPTARVQAQDGTIETANVQKLLREGDPSQNFALEDGTYVYVTGAETIRVQVLGAVSRPGNVEVNEGDRLSMALARAGTEAATRPDLNKIYLTRINPETGKTLPSYEINLFQALKRGDQRYDPILQKDDKIFVPEARSVSPAMIGVLGIIGRLLGF
ncbi:MAG TPA: polysaccharide biosynthesis/export family protein [Candidatus Elarobacter sp.]|jgi:polysaccharide export outer membrane protein